MKNLLLIWLWLCAWLNCAGWFLSAIHQLNAIGYIATLAIAAVALWMWKMSCDKAQPKRVPSCAFQKFSRRYGNFGRPFPLAFLILAVLAFIGGAIHAPNNYDALAYRLPRILHWLAAGQWHWIHTEFPRVNTRACGVEWLSAPLLALFRTDRLLFLINIISFLFLPGLLFSVMTRLGVRTRTAWHWMWLAPSGYCFVVQAGSIANDAFAAPFALAAIDFALRAKISQRPRDAFASILAAALMTSAKTGNITLLLPWAIAFLPSLAILLRRPLATAAVCVMAVFASFLPSAVLNYHYCRDWSGLTLENVQSHGSVLVRAPANAVLVSVLNLSPPVFPGAGKWNDFILKHIPPGLEAKLQEALTDPAAYQFAAPEMQIEESAGQGFGLTLLLLASVIVVVARSGKSLFQFQIQSLEDVWRVGLILAPWVSTFALVSQSEIYGIGRVLAPNYLLILPLLLAPAAHGQLVKKTGWRLAAFLVFAMAAGLLVISPARPLFPATSLMARLQARHPGSAMLVRTANVYAVYHDRNHAFQPILNLLPPDLKTLGFITYDDPETSLWRPFGSRTVFHVCPHDTSDYLKTNGVQYILAKSDLFGPRFPNYDDWLKQMNAQTVQTIPLYLRAGDPTNNWYFIKLN